jgi:hypothetical protein
LPKERNMSRSRLSIVGALSALAIAAIVPGVTSAQVTDPPTGNRTGPTSIQQVAPSTETVAQFTFDEFFQQRTTQLGLLAARWLSAPAHVSVQTRTARIALAKRPAR